MAIPRKRGRVLTEAGKKKIADILVKHEINWRNRVSWIHDKISTTGDNLSKDTIRKILDLGSADLSSFETIFKALEDKHEDGIDSVQDSQDTITNTPKSNSETSEKCPYRGLSPFRKEDAQFFFGRENFVETLVEAVQTQPFVAVVGNSGFGKSSVINAGLIPKLEESEIFKITTFRPQNNPFYKLANALIELFDPEMRERDKIIKIKENVEDFKKEYLKLKDFLKYKLQVSDSEQRYLIFIDQFEELYTLCSDDDANIFIKQLIEAIDIDSKKVNPDIVVVITLRTDFLEQALPHPNLGKALEKWSPKYLLRMNYDELAEVIEKPAEVVNLRIQSGLKQIILNAVKNNQGELTLLEFTLHKLWQKRSNDQLAIAAYDEIGGVEKALTNHAEDVYNNLSEDDKKKSQYIFTQLVSFGEKTSNTRRLATRNDIGEENWNLVTQLAGSERELEARLVTTGYDELTQQPTVEVVHEALIKGWKRLQDWMKDDWEFRKWQDRLRTQINIWENKNKDNGALLRGALLIEAKEWLRTRIKSINNPKEIEFIVASRKHQEQEDSASNNACAISVSGTSIY